MMLNCSYPAASKLVKISDPNEVYVKNIINLDHCLNDLEEGQFDLLIGFVHKDAAASFCNILSDITNTINSFNIW